MTKIEQKIPEGWSVKKLKDITILLTNGFVGTASIHYSDAPDGVIYIQGFNITKGGFNLTGIKKVTQEFHLKNKKSSLKYGDLLTIQTGDIGITAMVQASMEGSNCHALIISRFDKSICFPPYFLHLYNSDLCQRVFKTIETGSTMKHLNVGDMAELKLLFPPLPEQEKIAGILSCWDDGIEKLSALIEKKKIQKKALMQQLLTGKHRLKGFPAPWHEVILGELIKSKKILLEKGKNLTAEQLKKGDIPVIAGGKTVPYYHASYTHDKPSITISASGAYAGYVWFHKEKIWASDCNVIQGSDSADTVFWGYILQNQQDKIYRLQTGGAQPHVYSSDIKSLIVPELDLAEQKAIAEILSKADEEIELLNKKLEAFKQEKKALMQQLLTGKIRVKVN